MTDSEAGTIDTVSAAAIRTIMPPYLVVQNFLEEETVAGLLDHALAHEAEFAPTRTGRAETGGTRPHVRVSVSMRNLGPFRPILKTKIFALLPIWIKELRVTPVASPKLETELVAHNEGAFYKLHIDTQTATSGMASPNSTTRLS